MIKIICPGKIKEKFLQQAAEEYLKRLSKYTKIEIIEVKDEANLEKALKIEGEQILKHIKDNDYVITLEIKGNKLSSEALASKIEKTLMVNPNIVLVLGGSYGLDETVSKRSDYQLSFSDMTFPYQLFRIILLEQLYRAFKIINNENYHK